MATKKIFLGLCAATAMMLLGLNLYGEVTTMRIAEDIPAKALKFPDDVTTDIDETLALIEKRTDEDDLAFAIRLTYVVQNALAHIEDWETQPPDLYSQRVPAKENLWLHLAGRFSSTPEVQRYHFADYRRTLERGIGICGDTSTMLSDILWDNNIPNSILAYQRHVVVEVRPRNQPPYIIDGDYGAHFENTVADPALKKSLIFSQYKSAGYNDADATKLSNILTEDFVVFKSTFDFMKKRYLMEKAFYIVKWLLPVTLLFICVIPVIMGRVKLSPQSRLPKTQ